MGQKDQIRGHHQVRRLRPGLPRARRRSRAEGALRSVTVRCRTDGDTVTVPVLWSTVPADAAAMLPMKEGSWNCTGPWGRVPRRVKETDRPLPVMVSPARRPAVVGKLVTVIGVPWRSHAAGTPRPTTSAPPARTATRESSRTLSAPAMPQACGDEPCPVAGCRPTHGDCGSGRSSSPTTTRARSGCWRS